MVKQEWLGVRGRSVLYVDLIWSGEGTEEGHGDSHQVIDWTSLAL